VYAFYLILPVGLILGFVKNGSSDGDGGSGDFGLLSAGVAYRIFLKYFFHQFSR